jgi:peptidoglycan-associated lipoprotein
MNSNPLRSSQFTRAFTLSALVAAAVLAGCSTTKLDDSTVPVETRNPNAGTGGASSGSTAQSSVTPVDLTKGNDDGGPAADRTVYFDFDSYVVKDEFRPVVERSAKTLAADRKKHVQIQGNTDERGGTEYNLALGQKRAEAVSKQLALLGASDSQVEAVSYGKERPAATGSDEAAYAKNRRAEIVYR